MIQVAIGNPLVRYPAMTLAFRLTCLTLLLGVETSYAQLLEFPLGTFKKQTIATRGENTTVLTLPFWDDFSTSGPFPDTTRWVNSANVSVNLGVGINPPTINAATFDGVDANGRAYSDTNLDYGPTDQLTSCPIDLAASAAVTYPNAADQSSYERSLYISWYWQMQGNAERPDPEDSLRLEFLNPGGEWQSVWSVNGSVTVEPDEWTQEVIQVPFSLWHDQFQFRFTSFSRQTAGFDAWHIDYVYMDVWRDANDLFITDRAIADRPGSIFGEFYAIPRSQYDAATDVAGASLVVSNLGQVSDVVGVRSTLRNVNTGGLVEQLEETSRVIAPNSNATFELNTPNGQLISDQLALHDTAAVFQLVTRINSFDTLLDRVDGVTGETAYFPYSLKVNDTAFQEYVIDNYFAYDDGSAEYIAGIATIGGTVVYEYVFREKDTITHLDAYFPAVKGNNQGFAIELLFLDELDNEPASELMSQLITLRPASGTNQFTRYPLEEPVPVDDTVYIGWRQQTNSFIGVGLDKSNDSGSRIYSSTRGDWVPNVTVAGSLMLRPVLDSVVQDTVTALQLPEVPVVSVYPNPARNECYVEGNIKSLMLVDTYGRSLQVEAIRMREGAYVLDLNGLPAGMYYLRVQSPEGHQQLRKLIKSE